MIYGLKIWQAGGKVTFEFHFSPTIFVFELEGIYSMELIVRERHLQYVLSRGGVFHSVLKLARFGSNECDIFDYSIRQGRPTKAGWREKINSSRFRELNVWRLTCIICGRALATQIIEQIFPLEADKSMQNSTVWGKASELGRCGCNRNPFNWITVLTVQHELD